MNIMVSKSRLQKVDLSGRNFTGAFNFVVLFYQFGMDSYSELVKKKIFNITLIFNHFSYRRSTTQRWSRTERRRAWSTRQRNDRASWRSRTRLERKTRDRPRSTGGTAGPRTPLGCVWSAGTRRSSLWWSPPIRQTEIRIPGITWTKIACFFKCSVSPPWTVSVALTIVLVIHFTINLLMRFQTFFF